MVAGSPGTGFPLGINRSGLLVLALVWVTGIAALTLWRWRQWQRLSEVASAGTSLEEGREVDALRRVTRLSRRPRRIEVVQCQSNLEPGVLWILRPKLLWPAGLSDRLSDAELDAVLLHEARHVDRRDNLSAFVQMVVETVFWFTPRSGGSEPASSASASARVTKMCCGWEVTTRVTPKESSRSVASAFARRSRSWRVWAVRR